MKARKNRKRRISKGKISKIKKSVKKFPKKKISIAKRVSESKKNKPLLEMSYKTHEKTADLKNEKLNMSRFVLRKLPTLVREKAKINLEHAQEPDTPYTLVYGS